MSEGAKVAVGRGAIGKEVKHGGLIAGVEKARQGRHKTRTSRRKCPRAGEPQCS